MKKEIENKIIHCINFAKHEEIDRMINNKKTTVKQVNKIAKNINKKY